MILAKNMIWVRGPTTPTPISIGSVCPVGARRVGGKCVQQEKAGVSVRVNPAPVKSVPKSFPKKTMGPAYKSKKK